MPNKNQGGRKTPRVNVGVPEPWHAIMRKLAAQREQPVLYLLISLAAELAKQKGITDLPPAPWEDEDEGQEPDEPKPSKKPKPSGDKP